MIAILAPQTVVLEQFAAPRKSRLKKIHPAVVATVFTETFSIHETMAALLANDRGCSHETLPVISSRVPEECFAICRGDERQNRCGRVLGQQNNPGIGWAGYQICV